MTREHLRNYIATIMPYDANLIWLGRENFARDDLGEEYIVVDSLSAEAVGRSPSYDADKEEETRAVMITADMTVSFFGKNAKDVLARFQCQQSSEEAIAYQRTHGISVMGVHNITDVGALIGTQQTHRLDADMKMQCFERFTMKRPAMDSVDFQFLVDK